MKTLLADRRYVWGLDSSLTGTGLAIIDLYTGEIMLDRFTTHGMASLVDRSCLLIDWLGAKYVAYKPVIILMESTFFGQRTAEALVLTKLNHAIEVGLYSMGGALYKGVAPPALKKYIVNYGRGRKAALQAVLEEQMGVPIRNNDLADGLGLAIMARDLRNIILNFPISQYDINDKTRLRDMLNALGDFLGEGNKADVLFSMLSGNSGNMFSITSMLPEIKVACVEREVPVFVRFNPNDEKKLIARPK